MMTPCRMIAGTTGRWYKNSGSGLEKQKWDVFGTVPFLIVAKYAIFQTQMPHAKIPVVIVRFIL